ncbi:MAG: hypothetical protein KJ808_03640 [Acidobacteria bacterium]|nr:hypothetical protein [Acidobacteriota bacterium]MBU4307566.1 hypothetical protein [Acidobacteriota bacterium]MCG2811069.1 hypothetical protein [Candidatus Aminicenantes bacterium]
MASFNMSEKAIIYNYILLTSQITIELEDVFAGKKLTEQQCELLKNGAILLSKIIEGATLVEGKEFKNGLTPSMEGLSIYGYALSTIRELNLIRNIKEKEFTEFFEELHNKIQKLIENRVGKGIDISLLKNFFYTFGVSLRGDVQKENYPTEKILSFNKRKQMNDYLFT